MNGREFLTVARETARGATEAHWRTAAGRAYYALLLELRDAFVRWGLSAPQQSVVHQLTRQRAFAGRDADLNWIGRWLERLRDLRNLGDYETVPRPEFATNARALWAIQLAVDGLTLLDTIAADRPRRAAIAAAIGRVLP